MAQKTLDKELTQLRIDQRRKDVARLTKDGFSIRAIAHQLGVSHNQVAMDQDALGIKRPKGKLKPRNPDRMVVVERLWGQGIKVLEISKTVHMTPTVIAKHLRERGLMPPAHDPKKRREALVALVRKEPKLTVKALSEQLTCSIGTLINDLRWAREQRLLPESRDFGRKSDPRVEEMEARRKALKALLANQPKMKQKAAAAHFGVSLGTIHYDYKSLGY